MLALGDLQYEDGTWLKFTQSYEASWGRVKSITYPAPGNHEYDSPAAAGYYDYFGARAGDRAKGYYSFDLGAWHLIALNSECSAVGGCGPGSPQLAWLIQDLRSHTSSACTLAFWHHPRFSSGQHGSDATYHAFWQALYDHDADLVLVGHDHNYERFAPQTPLGVADPARGIRQFVVGTGGKTLRPFATVAANSEVRESATFGILKLTLHPTSYDWAFVPEAGRTFTDTGSGTCHSLPAGGSFAAWDLSLRHSRNRRRRNRRRNHSPRQDHSHNRSSRGTRSLRARTDTREPPVRARSSSAGRESPTAPTSPSRATASAATCAKPGCGSTSATRPRRR